MSQFKSYALLLDQTAKEAFDLITKSKAELKAAEERRKAHPMQPGLTPEAAAKAAKIESEYQTAKGKNDNLLKSLPEKAERKAATIRQDLAASVAKAYTVRPSDLDRDLLTLLESGILNATDFAQLMNDNATTPTMKRLVAKYATDAAAKAESNGDRDTARNLRVIAQSGNDGRNYLAAFDSLNDTFNRTMKNHAMIPYWEQLTAPIIDSF